MSSCPSRCPRSWPGCAIATVSTIALATVAAFVIPEGLGRPIFLALRQFFNTELIVTAILAVALALVADGLLVLAQRGAHSLDTDTERDRDRPTSPCSATPLRFIQENPGLLWDKAVEQLAAVGGGCRRRSARSPCRSGSASATCSRYSFVAISVANIGRALRPWR